MFKNVKTYYEIISGFRRPAACAIFFDVTSGLLESLSLVCLIPALSKFMNSGKVSGVNLHVSRLVRDIGPFENEVYSAVFFFVVIGLMAIVSRSFVQKYLFTVSSQVEMRLNSSLTGALLNMQWSQLVHQTHGNINKVILNDSAFIALGVESFISSIGRALAVLVYFFVSIAVGGKMAILLLIFGALGGFAYYFCVKKIKHHSLLVSASAGEASESVSDVFLALKYVLINGSKAFAQTKITDSFAQKSKAKLRMAGPIANTQMVGQSLGVLGVGSIMWFAISFLDGLNPELAIFSGLVIRMVPKMQGTSHTYANSVRELGSYESYLRTYKNAVQHAGMPQVTNRDKKLSEKISFSSSISMSGISYDHGNDQGLRNVDVEIKKSEWIGICGPSGGGKTTFLDLFCGLYRAQAGEFLIDGKNLYDFNLDAWRELISVVVQNPPLFSGTIAKNIAWADPNPNLERMKKSAIEANAYEFIQSLGGFETIAGIAGAKVSGGQKQRIALTQALYAQSEILILDEATNGLDTKTSEVVMSSFRKIKNQGVTGIIVSHDTEMFQLVDRLYVIEQGKVTEVGAFQDLVNDKRSRFNVFYGMNQKAS